VGRITEVRRCVSSSYKENVIKLGCCHFGLYDYLNVCDSCGNI